MLTVLRKVRKSLVGKGSSSRYLLYALGEIALVVVGILIALQFNNWNEARKLRTREYKLLSELKLSVDNNISKNRYQINRNRGSLEAHVRLIGHFEAKRPYNDTLLPLFANAHNRWVVLMEEHAYQNAKDFGLDFIRNDTIKRELVSLFEGQLDYLEKLDARNKEFYQHTVIPELLLHFEEIRPQGRFYNSLKPLDYPALLSNRKYLSILKSSSRFRYQYYEWQRGYFGDMEDLSARLTQELEARR